ncbi:methyltransferase domain-containing protein [Deinococcus malanensis]|uniref:methyltransferase domain-containing protein n=1 Tax=Deinococcus malanensis TaxID=1706855 RepID=UPI00364203A4
MDEPDCDPQKLRHTYAQFGIINILVSGWRRIYTRHLRPGLSPAVPRTLLDIGCGGGDVPLRLARWAKRDGLMLRITAIDADSRAIAYASARPAPAQVQFRQALSSDLVWEGQQFDFITSNHLLHHLTAEELTTVLQDSEQLCRGLVIHNDIERSALAYAAFRAGTARFFPGPSFMRTGCCRSAAATRIRNCLRWRPQAGWPGGSFLP